MCVFIGVIPHSSFITLCITPGYRCIRFGVKCKCTFLLIVDPTEGDIWDENANTSGTGAGHWRRAVRQVWLHGPPCSFSVMQVTSNSCLQSPSITVVIGLQAAFEKSRRLIRLIWSPLLPFVYSIVSIRSIGICVRLLHRDYSEHDLSPRSPNF